MQLDLVTVVVRDYDEAIQFFTGVLGFDLAADESASTEGGEAKRWVVVRPPGGGAGLLLAQADGDEQESVVGHQAGGRVGFFLRVDDFDATFTSLVSAGVTIVRQPVEQPWGRVAVFADVAGNHWDLLGNG